MSCRLKSRRLWPLICGVCCLWSGAPGRSAEAPVATQRSELQLAAEVDRLIEQHYQAAGVAVADVATDEDFLRRVSLDLAGSIPTPRDVTLFGLNPDPQKRLRLIDRLLDSDGYADLWASYWSDVIFSHATQPQSRVVRGTFDDWMSKQLASNRPWSEIATQLLTATGRTDKDGQTALIIAHLGDSEELAGESCRIFLGIQIQCANCHNHPTDSWTREQFHQLAAFFPRISVRRDRSDGPLEFVVTSFDADDRSENLAAIFGRLDRNQDGRLTAAEVENAPRIKKRFEQILQQADTDHDGALSKAEFESLPKPNQQGRGSAEHYMADLSDPTSRGALMQPVFFLGDHRLKPAVDDHARRADLARQMTSKGNLWFRKAFVNRMWGELLGEGFYMPIDDIGPERQARFEDVLDVLAKGFAAHGDDIKWLLRTITQTRAYQRRLVPSEATDESLFAAASPTRLRADQIYNVVTQVLGIREISGLPSDRRPGAPPERGNFARRAFGQLFGYDPSTPQADILGNIPQALFMMNSPQLEQLERARGNSVLSQILRENSQDDDALRELYLRVLSREPNDRERAIAADYIQNLGDRSEAFEDLFWALLNSSEFLTKR